MVLAGAADVEVGALERPAFDSTDVVPVRLRTAQGTCILVASGAITAGSTVFAAAGGKVAQAGTVTVGIAFQAATANNDLIEVMRI